MKKQLVNTLLCFVLLLCNNYQFRNAIKLSSKSKIMSNSTKIKPTYRNYQNDGSDIVTTNFTKVEESLTNIMNILSLDGYQLNK